VGNYPGERGNMTINSKRKGAAGERELAKKLTEYGYKSRRGQQYNGLDGEDVVGLSGIHIECKRVEKLNLYDAVDQSKRDCEYTGLPFEDKLPAVFHRKNNCEWLVTMPLECWIELYKEWSNGL
jgi:Holliday junction resolvase